MEVDLPLIVDTEILNHEMLNLVPRKSKSCVVECTIPHLNKIERDQTNLARTLLKVKKMNMFYN